MKLLDEREKSESSENLGFFLDSSSQYSTSKLKAAWGKETTHFTPKSQKMQRWNKNVLESAL